MDAHVVVLAGSALRSAPLEALAEALRSQGNQVEVVAGVDRRRVELLKLSFRHRGRASYLLLGGPALRADVLRSIATELEANGVPAGRISAGPVAWEDSDGLLRQATERLAAMGEPPPMVAAGPMPPTPHLPAPPDPIPSGSVPVVSAASTTMTAGRISAVPRPAWAVAGVAALGVLAFAISALTSSEDAAADSGDATMAAVASPFSIEAEPVAESDPDPADAAIAIEVEPLAEPVPEDATEQDAAALEDDDLDPPMELPEDDDELVYAALRNQEIRAIDILLVSPPKMKQRGRRKLIAKANFEDARDYCHSLDVEGVVGWRLPDVGEAQWLSRSNMIRTGVYWTATKADAFGGERVTWNARSKRMRANGKRWRGGRTVCVRFSKPDDPGPK